MNRIFVHYAPSEVRSIIANSLSANNTTHQVRTYCTECKHNEYSTEPHAWTKESSTRYVCACGKVIENGVIKSIRPGEEIMGIDDGLIDAYFLFENFEPLEDELTGVESAEIIAACDVMTVSDVTKEESVDNILPSDVFGETDATPEKRPLPAEEEHSELTGPMEGTLELVEKDIVFEEEVPDLETKIISEPVAKLHTIKPKQ